ncbi:DUF6221 family protein [Streptomyces mirabilis]|uniref:DUF6221 family protein n=1 Tax=Streptomyces mirabilis TaxID=68239 RepID=UPI00340D1CCD
MTDTDQLVVWLRETMDAAERTASRAAGLCGCHPPAPSWEFGDESTDGRILVVDEPHPGMKRKIGRRWNGSYEGMAMAEHIVRHDPEAVLRRIAADRKQLAEHAENPYDLGYCRTCTVHEEGWAVPVPAELPCPTIRNLAEGYGWTEETTS